MKNDYTELLSRLEHLEKCIPHCEPVMENDENMAKRLKEKVTVNGKTKWIDGYSIQELMDHYVDLLVRERVVERVEEDDGVPLFGEYLQEFVKTYKADQGSSTMINRQRVIKNHILPKFGDWKITKIRTMDIQKWYNELGQTYSRETILKIRNTMSPALDSAVEEEIITRNPMKSTKLVIHGAETVGHKALPKEKMEDIRNGLKDCGDRERIMGGLLSYTGMRFEEVLGLRWEDFQDGNIYIRRAVIHPSRNQPEVKKPKTKTSERCIPCPEGLSELLTKTYKHGYLLYTDKDAKRETPLSYTEARRVFEHLRERFDIREYSAHDFRDTCATEWREKGIPLDIIARMLGHSKTETTERRYVKYREEGMNEYRDKL